jgi:hypothetical protein
VPRFAREQPQSHSGDRHCGPSRHTSRLNSAAPASLTRMHDSFNPGWIKRGLHARRQLLRRTCKNGRMLCHAMARPAPSAQSQGVTPQDSESKPGSSHSTSSLGRESRVLERTTSLLESEPKRSPRAASAVQTRADARREAQWRHRRPSRQPAIGTDSQPEDCSSLGQPRESGAGGLKSPSPATAPQPPAYRSRNRRKRREERLPLTH